jgi:hypothetical protein
MIIKNIKSLIPKLILSSLAIGILVGILELYIGHRFILDPLLYEKEAGFTYETYFAPTFYGMTKSIVVAITSFLVFLFTAKTKMNLLMKSALIGILGTTFFGIYYYFTFPHVGLYATVLVGIVHFSFIAGITYIFSKIVELKKKKKK